MNADSIIAALLAQHSTEQATLDANRVTVTVTHGVRSSRVTTDTAAVKPTLDAKSFLLALRNAGKRTVEGKVVFDQSKMRDDSIDAIVAYTGLPRLTVAGDFGNQDREARARANRELAKRPMVLGLSREERRAVERSARGFVHGMPDMLRAKAAELLGRETATAEELIEAQKVGNKAEVVRLTALLSNVRDELSKLGAV